MLLPFNLFTGRMADRAGAHFASPALWGACNWRVGSSGEPMTIQHDGHYRAYRRQVGPALTADYDDAVSDIDMQYGCQSVLMADQQHFLGLAIMRGRAEGRCDQSSLFAFSQVIRHARSAVRIHLALDGEAGELLVGNWSDRVSPMLVLDRFGGLCAMTQAGEALLDEGGPLALRGVSIAARDRREDRYFQGALARLLGVGEGDVGPHLIQMIVGRPDRRWRLSVLRLPRRPHGLGFDPHLVICGKMLRSRSDSLQAGTFDAGLSPRDTGRQT